MDGITPGMVVGVNTEVIAGEHHIVTAGAMDAHGEFGHDRRTIGFRRRQGRLTLAALTDLALCRLRSQYTTSARNCAKRRSRAVSCVPLALETSDLDPPSETDTARPAQTTLFGGGTGPTAGSSATTCTPSGHYIHMMMAATDGIPLNFGFTGKGCDSGPRGLEDQIRNGAIGLKVHEVSCGRAFVTVRARLASFQRRSS